MLRSTSSALYIAVLLFACGSNCSYLSAQDSSSASAEAWSDSVRRGLTIPSDDELLAKRQEAQQHLETLLVALDELPDGGWIRRVAQLDALQPQLDSATPDVTQLEGAYDRLRHGYDSRVQPHIDRLRNSVDELRGWWALKNNGLNEEELEKNLTVIRTQLEAPAASFTTEHAAELRAAFAWFARWRRVDHQLTEANLKLSQPNQILILSEAYMKTLVSREIVHSVSVNEMQDDAQISGQGDIYVVPKLDLVPHAERGEVLIHVDGQGVVPLVAVSKQATVYANSMISFRGDQALYLLPSGVETPAPLITADSDTSLQSVSLSTRSRILKCLLRRLVERVASRKLSESDIEAAQRAQSEIESEVVDNSLAFASQLNDMMDRFFFRTFDSRDVEPNVRVSTTESELTWSAQYQARWQMGALAPAPKPAEPVGVLLQFHESAFNNASSAIGGIRMGEPTFQEVVYGMFRLQPPDNSWQQGGRIPAALHLAEFDPLEIHFQNGQITAKLTISAFEFGGRRVEGMYQIEATYEPHVSAAGVVIERIGEPQIQPQDGADSQLLEQAVARFFLPRAEARPRPNPRRGNKLALNYFQVEDGWLSFGLSPKPASPAAQE